jgi:predicted dehydrogenase
MRNKLHYDWHWVWETGNGDIGNQGVHEMDLCRWFLGNKDLPERVMSIGGRFGYDDDATTPNTLMAYYDYKPVPFIFEVRGLPSRAKKEGDPGNPPMDAFGKLIRIGMWVQGENGYFAAGEGGGSIYDKAGKRIKQFTQNWKTGSHQQNFITAVKSRRPQDNKCDAEVAHLSAALCHLGNIPYRVGKEMLAGEITEQIKSNSQASEAFERMKDHLAKNEVDLAKTKIVYGPSLQFDSKTERFTGELSAEANKYVSREYRAPFVVPETV